MRIAMRRAALGVTPVLVTCFVVVAVVCVAAGPAAASSRDFRIVGAGWGHGVGMSQDGAYAMARAGYSAPQIVSHYYSGARIAPYNDNRLIRVNVGHRVARAQLRSLGPARGGGSFVVRLGSTEVSVAPGTVVTLIANDSNVAVQTQMPGQQVVQWGAAQRIGVTWAPGRFVQLAAGSRSFARGTYRYGTIDTAVVGGKLEVVNSLRLHDEYLLGIAEVSNSWPMQALQAQVIAARSFALARLAGNRRSCRCDVTDGTGDQVFIGYRKELTAGGARWRAAVLSTDTSAGTALTLVRGGRPIAAYYFSSSGGRTENSQDVWATPAPWARSVDDHWSLLVPGVGWSVVRSQEQLSAAFKLNDVASVAVVTRFASNSARSVVATSSTGRRAALSGDQFVSRLHLKSRWIYSVT